MKLFVLKCPDRMTIALRYLLSNPSSSQSSFLPSQLNIEDTKTSPVEEMEEKDLTSKPTQATELQKDMKPPLNNLEILKKTE